MRFRLDVSSRFRGDRPVCCRSGGDIGVSASDLHLARGCRRHEAAFRVGDAGHFDAEVSEHGAPEGDGRRECTVFRGESCSRAGVFGRGAREFSGNRD
ncbi:MAG: hypothetical protein DI536_34185 [Archangium gephyra]|uniref:Uncharacterized protein n=1 Tax=Archangium gephyra TaxID=48 RepID=A0A2W5SP60_9BACT|nr:MAG: hypothetical protein DI536_34185 [Archangium gephyra]